MMEISLYWSLVFNVILFSVIVYLAVELLKKDSDVTLLRAQNNVLHAQVTGLNATLEQKRVASEYWELISKSNSLDSLMVKRLLGLCHPDKHNNSKAATEVTQWLLDQR